MPEDIGSGVRQRSCPLIGLAISCLLGLLYRYDLIKLTIYIGVLVLLFSLLMLIITFLIRAFYPVLQILFYTSFPIGI